MKFSLDCFTEKSIGTKCPENSYDVYSLKEVNDIIHNCSREIAGIKLVEVWIDGTHEGDPI